MTDVGMNEVVAMLSVSVSLSSLLPLGIILLDGVAALVLWLISSSLHQTPFLPHDHTCVPHSYMCRIPTHATVDCIPEHDTDKTKI